MNPKRYFGLALVLIAVVAALGLDYAGRDHYPRRYTVDFASGTSLSETGERQVDQIAAIMARQPAYDAVVIGHTGTRGDPEANQALGLDRAEAVAQTLRDAGIATDRLETHSMGGAEPLEQRGGEGERGYQRRLSRAEVRLNP
ncbi:OmpA family protein [Arhodomonas sp. AD133]|uniref:OmpA family protein n=1 Tax=Arhodomonas sp. AD133 TaxID=3415009 RepID=UPI003EBD9EB1